MTDLIDREEAVRALEQLRILWGITEAHWDKALDALRALPSVSPSYSQGIEDAAGHMCGKAIGLFTTYMRGAGESDQHINFAVARFHEALIAEQDAIRSLSPVSDGDGALCEDCPPVGYPTDETRCLPCPRRKESEA